MPIKFTILTLIILFQLGSGSYSYGQNKPKATILSPMTDQKFVGGALINYSGTGYDAVDGNIPDTLLTCIIKMNHGKNESQHWHIQKEEIGKTGSFRIDEYSSHALEEDLFFRIFLIATNSKGISDTTYTDIYPKTSLVTIQTEPSGLKINIDGYGSLVGPVIKYVAENFLLILSADNSQMLNGETYTFSKWSNQSSAKNSVLVVPNNDTTLTAFFTSVAANQNPQNEEGFKFYPNPVLKSFQLSNTTNTISSSILYDCLSKERRKFVVQSNSEETFDVSDLEKGIYYLKIFQDHKIYVKKMFKE